MKLLCVATVTSAAVVFSGAYGGQSGPGEIVDPVDEGPATQLVKPSDRIFEIADFEDAGLKHAKGYKTVGLPAAVRVSLFFWKIDGTPVQYQVRLDASHDEAVASGLSYNKEDAGREAIIDPDFARYTEGMRDRDMEISSSSAT